MKKSVSTLVAALCLAVASTAAVAQTQRTTKGGSDYERSMQQAGMSGMSGMSGMTGTTVAPTDKPVKATKAHKSHKKAKKAKHKKAKHVAK